MDGYKDVVVTEDKEHVEVTIFRFDLSIETLKFPSMKQAAKILGVNKKTIIGATKEIVRTKINKQIVV